jgi:hypothetical protein
VSQSVNGVFGISSVCNLVQLSIAQIDISNELVRNVEIIEDAFSLAVKGVITIEDTNGDVSRVIANGSCNDIHLLCQKNIYSANYYSSQGIIENYFCTTKIETKNEERVKIIILYVQDLMSYELMRLNRSDSFKDKSCSAVLMYYICFAYFEWLKKYIKSASQYNHLADDKQKNKLKSLLNKAKQIVETLESKYFKSDKSADERMKLMIDVGYGRKSQVFNSELSKYANSSTKDDIGMSIFMSHFCIAGGEKGYLQGDSYPLRDIPCFINLIGGASCLPIENGSTSSIKSSFLIPLDSSKNGEFGSVYKFLLKKLRESNIRIFFQRSINKFAFASFGITDNTALNGTKLFNLNKINILYTNKNLNQNYLYHIHDYKRLDSDTSKVYHFKTSKRQLNGVIVNQNLKPDDLKGLLELNSNFSKYKDLYVANSGTQESVHTSNISESLESQKYDAFEEMIQYNKLLVYSVGSNLITPGTLINVEIVPPTVDAEEAVKGDPTLSGMWFVKQVTRKLIGDKYIMRLLLCRFDNPENF